MDKIRIYVYSLGVSTLGFVDKEGAQHVCARAGDSAFSGLKHYPGSMNDRYLSDEEKKTVAIIEEFCSTNNCEFEVIDLATSGFLTQIKAKVKGLTNFPAIVFKERVFHGVPTEENLRELVK